MSLSLAVNANNDIYVGADGSLATARDLQAVLQVAQQAAQTLLGEMVLAVNQGLPFFQTVWTGAPNIAQFEAYLRRAVLAVDGVTEITELDTAAQGNVLQYRATIKTVYGTGAING